MTNDAFRSPDEQAMIEAARQRAQAAYTEVTTLANQAHMQNVALLQKGMNPMMVGQFNAPTAPATYTSAMDVIRAFDGQAQWYATEAEKLRAALGHAQATLAHVNRPPAALAPGPRKVPLAMTFAELTRPAWTVLRLLLFPPFTMLAGVAVGALWAAQRTLAPVAILVALAALWGYSIHVGLKRARLLAVGEVGTVLQRIERMGASRNRNVPMLRARGWDVFVETYSGMSHVTDFVVQTSRGTTAKASVSHGPAFDGVVLVDPDTLYACSNLDMGSCPSPDGNGQWTGSLSLRTMLTTITALTVSVGIIAVAALLASGFEIFQ